MTAAASIYYTVPVYTCPSYLAVSFANTTYCRAWDLNLLWKLSEITRIVLVLVVDDMPVGLVGLNALWRQRSSADAS